MRCRWDARVARRAGEERRNHKLDGSYSASVNRGHRRLRRKGGRIMDCVSWKSGLSQHAPQRIGSSGGRARVEPSRMTVHREALSLPETVLRDTELTRLRWRAGISVPEATG